MAVQSDHSHLAVPSLDWLGNAANAWDIWLATREDFQAIERRQWTRLGELVAFARARSPFYRRLYHRLPETISDQTLLPVVSKNELMEDFNDWLTDPSVNYDSITAFLADRSRIGTLFDDQYAVWKSSGTSGHPGIFLHDRDAMAVYDLLFAQRAWTSVPFNQRPTSSIWGQEWRMACITASEDHFAGISSWRHIALSQPLLGSLMRDFSVLEPLDQTVKSLNAWQPTQIVAYPSVLSLLAREQKAGRLDLSPAVLFAGGECLDRCEHDLIESVFGCALRCIYACSECDYIAFECPHHNLHVNADWIILEPVDAEHRPVEPGVSSHTVLLTNLANHIQPIIRYELGDSITILPEPCPCGSSLPAIRVEGRRNEVLRFRAGVGGEVTILPMAITTVLDLVAGLRRFQIVRDGSESILVRCEFANASDVPAIKQEVRLAIAGFLADRDLSNVNIAVEETRLATHPVSGKFHQVISKVDN